MNDRAMKELNIAAIRLSIDVYELNDDHAANVDLLQGLIELLKTRVEAEKIMAMTEKLGMSSIVRFK